MKAFLLSYEYLLHTYFHMFFPKVLSLIYIYISILDISAFC